LDSIIQTPGVSWVLDLWVLGSRGFCGFWFFGCFVFRYLLGLEFCGFLIWVFGICLCGRGIDVWFLDVCFRYFVCVTLFCVCVFILRLLWLDVSCGFLFVLMFAFYCGVEYLVCGVLASCWFSGVV